METRDHAFRLASDAQLPAGVSSSGISETFPTLAPLSLYGATKLASETLALEYGEVVEPDTLEPAAEVRAGTVCAVAGRVGKTRLIDNTILGA